MSDWKEIQDTWSTGIDVADRIKMQGVEEGKSKQQKEVCSSEYEFNKTVSNKTSLNRYSMNETQQKNIYASLRNYKLFFQYVLQYKLNQTQLNPKIPDNTVSQPLDNLYHSTRQPFILHSQSLTHSCENTISREKFIQKIKFRATFHQGFYCNLCGIDPIVGARLHCNFCDDFDICQKCHTQYGHQHSLQKIDFGKVQKQIGMMEDECLKVANFLKKNNHMIFGDTANQIKQTNFMVKSLGMLVGQKKM